MNTRLQDMKTYLAVMGADLGLGKSQFDFVDEVDIVTMFKNEPFNFDHWMVSMVRGKPSVDLSYMSAITFWVRVMGVPHPTFSPLEKSWIRSWR